jgi:hypothetical protein
MRSLTRHLAIAAISRIHRSRRLAVIASVIGLLAAGVAAPAASAEVNYSPRYWELLDRYASVEITWAPIRGAYTTNPECALRQQQGEPIGCQQVMAIMTPDGSFGGMWIADPAAPDGWRTLTDSDCPTFDDFEHPGWWSCYWNW